MSTSSVAPVQISALGSGEVSGTLKLMKLAIALKFSDPNNTLDSISVQGTLAIKQGFSPAAKRLILNVGGILRVYDLNASAGGDTGTDSFRMILRTKAGNVIAQKAKFTAKLSGNFKSALNQIGFANATNKRAVIIPVITSVSVDGTFYSIIRKERYKSKLNLSGTGN